MQKTKKAYVEALLNLCERKPLGKITVSELVEATDTARQTFFNHFKDINDLISYVPVAFYEESDRNPYHTDDVRAAFLFVLDHRGFFSQVPHHEGQNNFRESYLHWIKQGYYQVLREMALSEPDYLKGRLAVDLYAYGVVDLFLEWCVGKMAWPPELLLEVIEETRPVIVVKLQEDNRLQMSRI